MYKKNDLEKKTNDILKKKNKDKKINIWRNKLELKKSENNKNNSEQKSFKDNKLKN